MHYISRYTEWEREREFHYLVLKSRLHTIIMNTHTHDTITWQCIYNPITSTATRVHRMKSPSQLMTFTYWIVFMFDVSIGCVCVCGFRKLLCTFISTSFARHAFKIKSFIHQIIIDIESQSQCSLLFFCIDCT